MDHVLIFKQVTGGWLVALVTAAITRYLLVFCPSFGSGISLFSDHMFGFGSGHGA